jgi:hypothetical protein
MLREGAIRPENPLQSERKVFRPARNLTCSKRRSGLPGHSTLQIPFELNAIAIWHASCVTPMQEMEFVLDAMKSQTFNEGERSCPS